MNLDQDHQSKTWAPFMMKHSPISTEFDLEVADQLKKNPTLNAKK